ncbi:ApaG domain-containing protein [Pavlovales sp. CCMP2436]|nr:ApaG domain-containing protein [Pavlovales sp. CCMP2436]
MAMRDLAADSRRITIVLYRSLLRATRELTIREPKLRVRQSVFDAEVQWQAPPQFRLLAPASSGWNERVSTQQERAREAFPTLSAAQRVPEDGCSREEIRKIIRAEIERGEGGRAGREGGGLDSLFAALRELQAQQTLARLSSSRTTSGVRVDATAGFLARDSKSGAFTFQYKIAVTNVGDKTVQLIGRHWVMTNSDATVAASVPRNSPGVVGQKPVLHPGQAFEYASGASFDTPQGVICGSFTMVPIMHGRAGETFEAIVGRFHCDATAGAGTAM